MTNKTYFTFYNILIFCDVPVLNTQRHDKCLTPLMWALPHGAYPVAEGSSDLVVAVHCIVAATPFPSLSCSLLLCYPPRVTAIGGQSYRRRCRGRKGRIRWET